jgi:MFS family permease
MTTERVQRRSLRRMEPLRVAFLSGYAVSMVGTGLAFPLTALYLREVLHVPTSQVAAYFAVLALAAMAVNPIAGTQADRRGPVAILGVAIALQVIGPVVLASASSLPTALAAAVINGAGNGAFFAIQTSLLVRLFGRPALGRIYGAQYMIMNLALSGSAVAAGILVARLGDVGYRTAFVVNGISYLAYGLGAWAVIRRMAPSDDNGTVAGHASRAWHPYTDRGFLPLIALQFCLVTFGFAQIEAVMPVVLRQAGEFSVPLIAGFLAVNGIVVVVVQPFATRACERIGARRGLALAVAFWLGAFACGLAAVTLASTPAKVGALAAFAAVFAVGETFISPSLQPLVADSAPEGRLGTYAGAISLTYSLGLILGPTLSLPLFDQLGVGPYWLMLVGGIAVCFLLLNLARQRRLAADSGTGHARSG